MRMMSNLRSELCRVRRPLTAAFAAAGLAIAVPATAQDYGEYYEWEPGEGVHEEEWYDPSDWFDDEFNEQRTDYERDWWDYEYQGYGGYGDYDYYGYDPYGDDVGDTYGYDYADPYTYRDYGQNDYSSGYDAQNGYERYSGWDERFGPEYFYDDDRPYERDYFQTYSRYDNERRDDARYRSGVEGDRRSQRTDRYPEYYTAPESDGYFTDHGKFTRFYDAPRDPGQNRAADQSRYDQNRYSDRRADQSRNSRAEQMQGRDGGPMQTDRDLQAQRRGQYEARRAFQDQAQRTPGAELRGQLEGWSRVTLPNQGEEHTIVRLRLEDGQRTLVDLGPNASLSGLDLQEGERIAVYGPTGRIDGRDVVMAREVRAGRKVISMRNWDMHGLNQGTMRTGLQRTDRASRTTSR